MECYVMYLCEHFGPHVAFANVHVILWNLKGTNMQHSGNNIIWVKNFQTELVAEIYSKSPVRAIGKVLLIKYR